MLTDRDANEIGGLELGRYIGMKGGRIETKNKPNPALEIQFDSARNESRNSRALALLILSVTKRD